MTKAYEGPQDPLWYKDAIVYELHVRSFHDSNGDGVGDFPGLIEKLDYLQDLGVNTIWILPFYPSPLRDDGYDIADYCDINPTYGTMNDFKEFLRQAHRRGLRVITELVLNHTSDQHPWFQRARRAPKGSRHRNFYVWSDTQELYKEARIIFKDFEKSNWEWDPLANAYYWHRFYAHQPDLNFDNPDVHKALFRVVDFWLGLGVDGLRLDAVPYLFEREGTSCENLPETHAFLKQFRAHVDGKWKNRMLLAEANQWPEDAAAYFGNGDMCQMAFHFPIMPRMFMSVYMEDRFPIVDILQQTPALPDPCQWALFLRNHDELTLEMVTDEERDYMYRVYANDPQARINLGIRRRLVPLLQNNRRKVELLNGLLFSLPGTPVIYYGDEIGMGDNIYLGDRNGVRTPMQWSSDRNAGFSRANPQRLFFPVVTDPEYHFEAVNVEAQKNNPHSLFWWMKRLMALSRRFKAFGRGTMEMLNPDNRKVLAFVRRTADETILVVANLSRFVQHTMLDLSAFRGRTPVELFGRTEFPKVGDAPYAFMMAPHTFYWFLLEPSRLAETSVHRTPPTGPVIEASAGSWQAVVTGQDRKAFEAALARWLPSRRWFAGKARVLKAVSVSETVPLPLAGSDAMLAVVNCEFNEGAAQQYTLFLSWAEGAAAGKLSEDQSQAVVARVRLRGTEGILYDPVHDPGFCSGLMEAIAQKRGFNGTAGRFTAARLLPVRELFPDGGQPPPPSVARGEQSNTCIVYGDAFVLKLIRRVENGVNPDLEIPRFLLGKTGFTNVPPLAGTLEYRRSDRDSATVGVMTRYVPNQGDGWTYTQDALGRYFETLLSAPALPAGTVPRVQPLRLADQPPPGPEILQLFGPYLEIARLLGQRTAELHLALSSDAETPEFAPEPFTPFYLRSVQQSMRNLVASVFPVLRQRLKELPENVRPVAEKVLNARDEVLARLSSFTRLPMDASRIRIHGDFHLGQALFTGKDFVLFDFEGEPARSLGERRLKRSALRDVAGMLRSFHYAAWAALFQREAGADLPPERMRELEAGANLWHAWAGSAFLKAYLERAGKSVFLPTSRSVMGAFLEAYVLEKAVYELGYELNNRPGWVKIPLLGIQQILEQEAR
ncbi:MAG: maltose alpha-D-glucosyltransferase [Candidatus Brocadiae bacterium]|nr:maltose alpha-D-glucosyltransferase [Candidatus Brocadiia bacterium]